MTRKYTRREAVQLGTAAAATIAAGSLAGGALARSARTGGHAAHAARLASSPTLDPSPVGPPFQADLFLPPDHVPVRSDATTDFYEVHEVRATTEIIPGIMTPVWGYTRSTAAESGAATVPGPTFRARSGRAIQVKFFNDLPPDGDPTGLINLDPQDPATHPFRESSTVVHAHGLNTDSASDGYPEHTIVPGESFTHTYPNNDFQRPATLWYHDHSVHITAENVYRGLKGFYILTGESEDSLPVPKGEFDVPLVISDAIMDKSGVLVYANGDFGQGLVGDFVTVNGRQQPRFEVAKHRYRLRLLNGSDVREYKLAFADNREFAVIGSDQGLLPAPVRLRELHIAPAERYDVVVDFGDDLLGKRVVLENRLPKIQDRGSSGGGDNVGPAIGQVMAFDIARNAKDYTSVPALLRPLAPLPPAPVREREFRFNRRHGSWSINGGQWDPDRVDVFPKLNTSEVWRLVNESGGWTHPIHILLTRFLILDRDGRAPRPQETGWKDTFFVGPNSTVRVIGQYANFTGKYVMHCHNLTHEDHDMMTQFEVVP